jgi:formylglycine-generating enzyme required for sulfatase activity
MNTLGKTFFIMIIVLILFSFNGYSQTLQSIDISTRSGLTLEKLVLSDSNIAILSNRRPLYSFLLNNELISSEDVAVEKSGLEYSQIFKNDINVTLNTTLSADLGWSCKIVFENIGEDTVSVSNVVPFGIDKNSVYITGNGQEELARARLYRPGYNPVRVILPDNAWELGYSSFSFGKNQSICSIARRIETDGGLSRRYETLLPPHANVIYYINADIFYGEWQNGLTLMFRDRYLYNFDKFDNSLYNREDLAWVKETYLIMLYKAWDRDFYDRFSRKYTYGEVIKEGIDIFGNIDVFGISATGARLDLDQSNQLDLYRKLPGGTKQIRNFAIMSRKAGTKFFIAYNLGNKSTIINNAYSELEQIISETEVDGVILDTKDSFGFLHQSVLDSIKEGVVLYSEGMAKPADMQDLITGRINSTIHFSPELNLNKLIKPDFSIFRVCDVADDFIHREIAIAFFNGYGTELNMYRPGARDDNYRDDLEYLSLTTFILRQNNDAFLDNAWTPMIETTIDSVYVNRWNADGKTIFTVLNMRPEGVSGKLFKVDNTKDNHFISLWNHENLDPIDDNGDFYISAKATGWHPSLSGTRKEGSVDCIAEFPRLIKSELIGDSIKISSSEKGRLMIWKGEPSYKNENIELTISNDTTISSVDLFGSYQGKIVLQLIENKRLRDENVLLINGGKPWLFSKRIPTKKALGILMDMVLVPGTNFSFKFTGNEDIIPYPEGNNISVKIDSFLIDKYPVTNAQYFEFLNNSRYIPLDTSGFLSHWQEGVYKQGQGNYPVVNVSYEDIIAYTEWADKRLPTQAEWQLAAQGLDKRRWPWGNEFHGTFCNNSFNRATPVDAFSKGQSPYGVYDMVGNIWQVTNDIYFNGNNYFYVIRGGSYYNPEAGLGYLPSGPQSLDKTQILPMVSQALDRSNTLGFRCVKDIDSKGFRGKRKR